MLYLWIMSNRRGKGYYLPEKQSWSEHLDIGSGILTDGDPILLGVTAEEGRWRAVAPEGYQWEDEAAASVEIDNGTIRRLQNGENAITLVVSGIERSNMLLKKYAWPRNEITIGKNERNTIVYSEMPVSHQHGVLVKERNEILYTDQSSNGSWLNGRFIGRQNAALKPGDHLFIVPALHILVFRDFIAVNHPVGASVNDLAEYGPQFDPQPKNEKKVSVWNDYHRAPRQLQKPDTEPISIDAPIEKQRDRKVPTWLAVGPSLTMVMPMLVSSVVMGRSMGASLVMIGTSSALSFMWSTLNRRYAEKDAKISEENRQKICTQYYAEMEEKLAACTERELKRLNLNYLPVTECLGLPGASDHRMWEKQPVHPDFLNVRIGIGEAALPNEISIPKTKIELVDDPLRHEPQRLKDQYSMIKNAPIVLDAKKHSIIGVLGNRMSPWLMQSMVVQLAAGHSYHDVRIAILHDEADADQWQFAHHLPHVFTTDDRTMRMVVSGAAAAHEVASYLDNVLSIRQETLAENKSDDDSEEEDIQSRIPWYMVFVTDPKLLEDEPIMRYLKEQRLGFTFVMLANQMEELPKECDLIIEALSSIGTIFHVDGTMIGVKFEMADLNQMQKFANQIAPYRIKETTGNNSIPSLVTFLETYHVTRIEELDICRNWNENHAWKSIRSVLGFKSGGVPFVLDISDKNHGPHGLIAGTTGAGKSVLLQSFILSLSLNYSPSEVQFILIDYKGGGTSEDFRDLPHAAGVIDSLQGERTIFRALASIQGEIKRREAIFKRSGVNNIDDYMKVLNSDPNEPTLGHIIIIVDEFAELKKEQPDFMRELVSAARVGRSLGMHLVLATQKPGNSVSEEIDANTRFRICLRVASRSDSTEMLKRPEAAYLKGMGRCYVQVGNNEVFEQVQTSWSGAVYNPEALRPEEEPRILNELGQPVLLPKRKNHVKADQPAEKREIDVVLEYISNACEKYHYAPAAKMWLEEMKETMRLEEVLAYFGAAVWKDGVWPAVEQEKLSCIFGMADDVDTQRRIPARVDFTNDHNIQLTGLSGSGKTMFLQTVAVSLAMTYSPADVNLYVFSLTSHVLSTLGALPHVGDIVFEDERDEQERLIDMLFAESNRRKLLFRDMSTDNFTQYNQAVRNDPNSGALPAIVVLVDGMARIREWENVHMENSLKKFYELLRTASGQGIYFIITGLSKNELPGTQQKFAKGLTLRQNERADYAEALNARITSEWGGIREYPGRGLLAIDDKENKVTLIYEMQTAVYAVTHSDRERSSAITELGKRMCEAWHGALPQRIARIPEKPVLADMPETPGFDKVMKDPQLLPIGYEKRTGSLFAANLHSFYSGMIIGPKKSGKTTWLQATALLLQKKGAQVYLVGSDELASWGSGHAIPSYRYGQAEWEQCFRDITKIIIEDRSAKLKQAKAVSVEEHKRVSASFSYLAILIDDLDRYAAAYPNTLAMLANFVADNEKIATYRVITYATVSRRGFLDNQVKEPFRTLRASKRGLMLQGATNDCDPFGVVYRLPRGVSYPVGNGILLYDDDMYQLVLPQVQRAEAE